MTIAISSQGPTMDAAVDSRFGRAAYFIVVDPDNDAFTVQENTQNLQAAQGAGIQAGKTVIDLGVEAVITGHVGPKAFATLRAGGVAIYTGATGTVADAVEQFRNGALVQADQADVEAHWT